MEFAAIPITNDEIIVVIECFNQDILTPKADYVSA
jgi:hypothetical protein